MKAADFQPIKDRVLIKQDPDEEITKAGILIPQFVQKGRELINSGVVIAIGPGMVNKAGVFIETTVKVGTRVVWRRGGGIQISALENHVITTEDELLGVIE